MRRFSDNSKEPEHSIESYLRDINTISPLSPEQENALIKRVSFGDRVAKKQLAELHLGLVASIAREYWKQRPEVDLADLIQEGNLGLLQAVETYDLTRYYKFSDYAMGWISKAISQRIANPSRPPRERD